MVCPQFSGFLAHHGSRCHTYPHTGTFQHLPQLISVAAFAFHQQHVHFARRHSVGSVDVVCGCRISVHQDLRLAGNDAAAFRHAFKGKSVFSLSQGHPAGFRRFMVFTQQQCSFSRRVGVHRHDCGIFLPLIECIRYPDLRHLGVCPGFLLECFNLTVRSIYL